MHRYPSTDPVIITCALTGGIHGKQANPNLPEQPDEIVAHGVAAADAGAAILHVHARNPDVDLGVQGVRPGELHARLCEATDVGMEDNVLHRRGEPLEDNPQLVTRAARIARELDRPVATPAQARELLALRGRST